VVASSRGTITMVHEMSSIVDERLAEIVRAERERRGWTIATLADRSGVSKAMISKVERGAASPTAALLGRLSGALNMTMSELLAAAEAEADGNARVTRRTRQAVWRDPDTGYRRRAVSPPSAAAEIIEVELPRGREVAYPADSYTFIQQQIWVLDGTLTFTEGAVEHVLDAGDCLLLGPPEPCVFANRSRSACRYAVVITKR
jgi:transcriptional regulator with XRE-family HTH domain